MINLLICKSIISNIFASFLISQQTESMHKHNNEQQRVATLIDSYREEIGGVNSKNVKAIQDYIDAEEKRQYAAIEKRMAEGEDVPQYDVVIEHPMELEYKIRANEQLLGHFYSKVAGSAAERNVLLQLLPDYYDSSFFSDEEELFLAVHFVDVVNYIIETSYRVFQEYSELKEAHLLSQELLELIASEFTITENSTIYNPFAGLGQLACIFKKSYFICEESFSVGRERNRKDDSNWLWAWMKVALFANGVKVKVLDNHDKPSSYDYAVSYIPYMTADFFTTPNDETLQKIRMKNCDEDIVANLLLIYQNLSRTGKMLLVIPEFLLWKSDDKYPMGDLWKQIGIDGSCVKVIQLPSTCNGLNYNFCILIIDKGSRTHNVDMVDARFAAKTSENKLIELEDYLDVIRVNEREFPSTTLPTGYRSVFVDGVEKMAEEYDTPFFQTIDIDLLSATLRNGGKDVKTGLRKMITVRQKDLDYNLMLPQVYVTEKPQKEQEVVCLSELCSCVTTLIRDLTYDIPMDTPWVKSENLSCVYQGPLDILKIEKAECPNNPPHTNDYVFDSCGRLLEGHPWYQRKPIGRRVLEYRKCTYLEANRDAVLIKFNTDGNPFAVLNKGNKPIAIENGTMVFCPNDGVQLTTLLAVLKMPIVYYQVLAYLKLGLSEHLNNIKIPFDNWFIENEVTRYAYEEKTISSLKTDYENIKRSVRMRKHALTQSLSSLRAMFNALNAYRIRKDGNIADNDMISRVKGTTVKEAFDYLSGNLKAMMPVLEHIADVEYTFMEPEWIDPESFIDTYILKRGKGWINFKAITTWDKGSNVVKHEIVDPSSGTILLQRGEIINQFLFPKDALEKVMDNIVSNAKSHGFDESRNDYHIRFSWLAENKTVKLLIENNGTPIPEDRDPTSLFEYGVSTALHCDGHNGIGCNEIDDIMHRYDGTVEIISTPHEEYTVKYLLTFFRSNSVY